ncbi:hypothetical protein Taro_037338 [Colocasia esculenta]|uniref:Uncharacterized protein n=1 Tax=Colocasia esculenta TaxID=4460 RepID=A0A843WAV7_COLES|nr:hypothetical protein [Colocasia esculenta]
MVSGLGMRWCSSQLCYNYVLRLWGSYPTEPMTCEAHPFFLQVKGSRRTHVLPLVRVNIVVESGPRH